jgi:acetyltransferase-like isoleucine patch superfamily enzyme
MSNDGAVKKRRVRLSDEEHEQLQKVTVSGDKLEKYSKLIPAWNWYKPLVESVTIPSTFRGELSKLHLGKNSSYSSNCHFNLDCGHVYLSEWAKAGRGVSFITGRHNIQKKNAGRAFSPDSDPTDEGAYEFNDKYSDQGNDIFVGEGVLIYDNATIIGPCRIGAHAVIAAGAVVFPGMYDEGCVYAGNPAKFLQTIKFEED